jgi:hypothetical protein
MIGRVRSKAGFAGGALWKAANHLCFRMRIARVGAVPFPTASKMRPQILFFAPEAGLHAHYNTCCFLAHVLQENGHEVFIARCYQQMDCCVFKASLRLPSDAPIRTIEKVCADCAKHSLHVQDTYGLKILDLRSLETSDHRAKYEKSVKELCEVAKNGGLADYVFEGLPLGKMCGYEVRLSLKVLKLDVSNLNVTSAWAALIRTAIKTHILVDAAAERLGFTKLVYFNDYSMNLAARFAMEARGGSAVMVTNAYHLGVDRSKYLFQKNLSLQSIFTDCLQWQEWNSVPLPESIVDQVTDDAIYRFSGRSAHTYSPPLGLVDQRVEKTYKQRVVIFTSSPDESACLAVLDALKRKIPPIKLTFGNSCEDCHAVWLQKLMSFAKTRPEIEFILRVHPREGANKREPNESEHLSILRKCLARHPANFIIYWPESPISSYGLGESADLVLTSWSTIGLEMARLGVPVLCCARGVAGYPVDDFQPYAETPDEYFKKIDELLCEQPSFERIRLAYRWWHLAYLSSSIDVSDVIPTPDFTALPNKIKPRRANDLCASILEDFNQRENILQKWSRRPRESYNEETEALKKNLLRIIHFFLTGIDKKNKTSFTIIFKKEDKTNGTKAGNCEEWIEVDLSKKEVSGLLNNKIIKPKYSPLVVRLCSILSRSEIA